MPELPEVETTRLGLLSPLKQQVISDVNIRQPNLRQVINHDFVERCVGQRIKDISRRAKYIKLELDQGYVLIHLGMSGHLRVLEGKPPWQKHDHIDIFFENNKCLRFNDPRRFGLVLWSDVNFADNPLLKHLGPEPLSRKFNTNYLYQKTNQSKRPIKQIMMDNRIVVGVGNIYAQESLFLAKLSPLTPAKTLDTFHCQTLVRKIKSVLREAIKQGGTSLKDFLNSEGKPGYFAQKLWVYGRQNQRCLCCQQKLLQVILGGRNTVYCPKCQICP